MDPELLKRAQRKAAGLKARGFVLFLLSWDVFFGAVKRWAADNPPDLGGRRRSA